MHRRSLLTERKFYILLYYSNMQVMSKVGTARKYLYPYDHSKVLRRRRQAHVRARYKLNLSIPSRYRRTPGLYKVFFRYYFRIDMHGLPIPKRRRCYGATVPCHFIHLTLHPSPLTPWPVRLPRFARQSAVAPQFLFLRSVSPSGKPPAITHRSCVSGYVPRPAPGPGQEGKKKTET